MNRNLKVMQTKRKIFLAIITLSRDTPINKIKNTDLANMTDLNRATIKKYIQPDATPDAFFEEFQKELLERVHLAYQIGPEKWYDPNIYSHSQMLNQLRVLFDFQNELCQLFIHCGHTAAYFFHQLKLGLQSRDFTIYRIEQQSEHVPGLSYISERQAVFFKNELFALICTWITSENPKTPEEFIKVIENFWANQMVWP